MNRKFNALELLIIGASISVILALFGSFFYERNRSSFKIKSSDKNSSYTAFIKISDKPKEILVSDFGISNGVFVIKSVSGEIYIIAKENVVIVEKPADVE